MSYLNLSSKPFLLNSDKWYNLLTNRYLTKLPEENSAWSVKGLKIVGTLEAVKSFLALNNLKAEIFNPTKDIGFLCCEAIALSKKCHLAEANLICKETDVEKMPVELLNKLGSFHLGGLFLKGRVLDVMDGDTLLVSIFVPLISVSKIRQYKEQKSPIGLVGIKNEKQGFFMNSTIRMYGYDAVEKNHPLGPQATNLLKEKLNSLKMVVWCYFLEPVVAKDKYGRDIAVLFEDEKGNKMLNCFLGEKDPRLVNPYRGGKKSEFN